MVNNNETDNQDINLEIPEAEEVEQNPQPTQEEKLQKELDENKDKYLRLAAEYDNFRKRSQKERETLYSDAKAMVIAEFLPVLDNFNRANEITDVVSEDYKKGIDMTFAQLVELFSKFGVESFGELDEQFDPNIHNAVMHMDDESFGENTITEVFMKGYKMGGKVLRPAMVKVAN
ncbi:MAG: nucleotide exchange factor GrpE [Clostridia bacterium]|nr:nucleotide exchange factor GrpE [Clostridia bacterium]